MCVSVFVYVCVWSDQCPHPSRATWPPRRHTSIPHFSLSLSLRLPPSTLYSHRRRAAAAAYDVCCVTQGHYSLSSCIFFPRLHSSVQIVSYTYRRGVSKPEWYLTCSHKMWQRNIWGGGCWKPPLVSLCYRWINQFVLQLEMSAGWETGSSGNC